MIGRISSLMPASVVIRLPDGLRWRIEPGGHPDRQIRSVCRPTLNAMGTIFAAPAASATDSSFDPQMNEPLNSH